MAILVTTGGWCAVRPTASGQSSGIEVSNSGPATGGEGNVRCAGFHTVVLLANTPGDIEDSLPRCFLAQEEVGVVNAETNLAALLSDEAVSKRL